MAFACWSTKSIRTSTKAWRRFGTPEVAPRITHQKKPMPSKPSRSDTTSVSTFSVQKPPSPTGFSKKLRWCSMYSEGVSALPAAIGSIASVVADKKRHGEYQHRDDECCDEDADHHLSVVRQHEPQQEHGDSELDCFGPQRAEQNFPCRLRVAPRSHECRRQPRNDAHRTAGGRRHRSLRPRQQRRGNRHCSRCRELPMQNRAYRLAQNRSEERRVGREWRPRWAGRLRADDAEQEE